MKSYLICLTLLFFTSSCFAQSRISYSVSDSILSKIERLLGKENPINFEMGGGFVMLLVKRDKSGQITIQKVKGTNKVIDSTLQNFFSTRQLSLHTRFKQDQFYMIPVFYGLVSGSNEISWKNSNYYVYRDIDKMDLPKNTLALRPIANMIHEPIRKAGNQ